MSYILSLLFVLIQNPIPIFPQIQKTRIVGKEFLCEIIKKRIPAKSIGQSRFKNEPENSGRSHGPGGTGPPADRHGFKEMIGIVVFQVRSRVQTQGGRALPA
jgi:hypothetical protein